MSYAIQLISDSEMKSLKQVAKGRADAMCKGKDYDQAFKDELYADELIAEIVFRSSKLLENREEKLFSSPHWISKHLTTDVIGTMFNNYEVVKLRLGPNIFQMSEQERQDFIARLAEGAGKDSEGFLGRLNLFVAKKLALDTTLDLIKARQEIGLLKQRLESLSETSNQEILENQETQIQETQIQETEIQENK